MKRFLYLLLFILMMVFTCNQGLSAAQVHRFSPANVYTYINDAFYNSYGSFNLTDYQLRLSEELSLFSPEARNELLNLASLYANQAPELNQEFDLMAAYQERPGDMFRISNNNREITPDTLHLTSIPGVLVGADYKQETADLEIEENTNIKLQYWMNNRTLIRAEYGLDSRIWWDMDINEITLDDEESTAGGLEDNIDDVNVNDDIDLDDPDDDQYRDVTFNREINEMSRLGISYKTSDRVTISADYLEEGEDGISDYSTSLGVEYTDRSGLLRYHYQVDFDQIDLSSVKKMESGFEWGIKDQAIFNASYQLLNPRILEDRLKESIWDFGLDLNLNERSTFSLGYQLKNNPEQNLGLEEMEEMVEKESNIKAQLEFKF